jgi:gluconokinase
VLACSALRQRYRRQLRGGLEDRIPLVYLGGDAVVLRGRLESRSGHYMKAEMLESQLAMLEQPGDAEGGLVIRVPLECPVAEAVMLIRSRLG